MKLFHKPSPLPDQVEPDSVPAVRPPSERPSPISLNDEQKAILEQPIDARVERILQGIYADKAAAEHALDSRQIIEFPGAQSGRQRVIQDQNGFWRILPGSTPAEKIDITDAL